MTPLDQAHIAMEADTNDDTARLQYFERLADAELFVLLAEEPHGDTITPKLFETTEGRFVLAFDLEERLTDFTEGPAPYAALSGRTIADMLNGQDTGLGLNLGVAPSSYLIPAGAMEWLYDTLRNIPSETVAQPETISAPNANGLPETLITSLDAKLSTATGLAKMAYLVAVTYPGGRPGHLLAFIDTLPGAEPALAKAISEALVFSGLDAGELDVAFFAATDAMAATLAKHGLRFDLPVNAEAKPPGSDPTKPPKLR